MVAVAKIGERMRAITPETGTVGARFESVEKARA